MQKRERVRNNENAKERENEKENSGSQLHINSKKLFFCRLGSEFKYQPRLDPFYSKTNFYFLFIVKWTMMAAADFFRSPAFDNFEKSASEGQARNKTTGKFGGSPKMAFYRWLASD